MSRPELIEYHSVAGILKSEPDRSKWKEFLSLERTIERNKSAKEQVGPRNSPLIKPILPVVVWDLPNEARTEKLVDCLITTIWSKDVQKTYNNLPKGNGNSAERRRSINLVSPSGMVETPRLQAKHVF